MHLNKQLFWDFVEEADYFNPKDELIFDHVAETLNPSEPSLPIANNNTLQELMNIFTTNNQSTSRVNLQHVRHVTQQTLFHKKQEKTKHNNK